MVVRANFIFVMTLSTDFVAYIEELMRKVMTVVKRGLNKEVKLYHFFFVGS